VEWVTGFKHIKRRLSSADLNRNKD